MNALKQNRKVLIGLVAGIIALIILIVFLFNRNTESLNGSDTTATEETTNDNGETQSDVQDETQSKGDKDKTYGEGDIWARLDHIETVCSEFYRSNFELTRLITKDGYLYNKAAEKVMTMQIFCDRYELFTENEILQGCDIMLLKPTDLMAYGIAQKEHDELVIYIFYQDPNTLDYLVTSAGHGTGTLTPAQHRDLLYDYKQDHGLAGRRFTDDPYYDAILKGVKQFENYNGGYYVRYLASDDQYACTVLSPESDYNVIKQYILVRSDEDGSWSVAISDLEYEPRVFVAVNQILPDLNLAIIPSYTIANEINFMFTDFDEVTASMKSNGGLSPDESGEIQFASATDTYMFIQYKSGKFFYGEFKDSIWNMQAIESPQTAEGYMLRAGNPAAPFFILLQE